jgi:hypothetical protein
VIDERDADEASSISALGYREVAVMDTVMAGREGAVRLARQLLALAGDRREVPWTT